MYDSIQELDDWVACAPHRSWCMKCVNGNWSCLLFRGHKKSVSVTGHSPAEARAAAVQLLTANHAASTSKKVPARVESQRQELERKTTHGEAGGKVTAEYRSWQNMMARCRNRNAPTWSYYGGRGVKVCDRWKSFPVFLADVGRRPTELHSLDRIDVSGNYEPGNVRWATRKVQSENRRVVTLYQFQGESLPATEIARRIGLRYGTVYFRLKHGWPPEKAFSPVLTNWPRGRRGLRSF